MLKRLNIRLRQKNIEDKIPRITNLATKINLNTKINEVKAEIPSISGLATTSTLTAIENKIPDVSNLVKKLNMTQKLMKLKRKLLTIVMINTLLLQSLIRKFCSKISTSKFSNILIINCQVLIEKLLKTKQNI